MPEVLSMERLLGGCYCNSRVCVAVCINSDILSTVKIAVIYMAWISLMCEFNCLVLSVGVTSINIGQKYS